MTEQTILGHTALAIAIDLLRQCLEEKKIRPEEQRKKIAFDGPSLLLSPYSPGTLLADLLIRTSPRIPRLLADDSRHFEPHDNRQDNTNVPMATQRR